MAEPGCPVHSTRTLHIHDDATAALIIRLLGIGGSQVEASMTIQSSWMATDAVQRDGGDALLTGGVPGFCHLNCELAAERDASLVHEFGYALSADGCWYEHSWLIDARGRIHETTCPREIYVGMPLRDLPAGIATFLHGEEWLEMEEGSELRTRRDEQDAIVGTVDRDAARRLLAQAERARLPLAA